MIKSTEISKLINGEKMPKTLNNWKQQHPGLYKAIRLGAIAMKEGIDEVQLSTIIKQYKENNTKKEIE